MFFDGSCNVEAINATFPLVSLKKGQVNETMRSKKNNNCFIRVDVNEKTKEEKTRENPTGYYKSYTKPGSWGLKVYGENSFN